MSALLPLIAKDGDIVGALLREQQSMTAVEQFSYAHESELAHAPAQERYYSRLMPATSPGPNQQLAFQVDLDSCSGCKACVVACHTLNGLDEHETWRSVGTLLGDNTVQHVTTACHHCEDPGCLNGCPVKAYVKDEVTGVVRHLDDQCIGCKYCTMMCPYEVPQYSERLGIVRKCDMCHQRLSTGEAPACVQSCPNEAIRIRIVDHSDASQGSNAATRLSPGAPLSSITRPTTRYLTDRPSIVGVSLPQNVGVDSVAESHWPLAAMLVSTQAAIGLLLIEGLVASVFALMGDPLPQTVTRASATIALLIAGIGMNLAPLHLGQPLRAWRVFLGLRTSWLSREAVVLGGFMGLLSGAVAMLWLPIFSDYVPEFVQSMIPSWAARVTLMMAIPVGLVGFYCSAMIYIATQRRLWRFSRTMTRFAGSMLVLGLSCFSLASCFAADSPSLVTVVSIGALIAIAAKLAFEIETHYSAHVDELELRSSRLVSGPLRRAFIGRVVLAAVTSVGLLLAIGAIVTSAPIDGGLPIAAMVLLACAVVLSTLGEFAERYLYFASVVFDRMPGTLK